MNIQLSKKEFRLLLDMAFIGNWVLNSTRGDDRFADYDALESKLFALCPLQNMGILTEDLGGTAVPSKAYEEGGIHEAIAYYEDYIFYQILAEELSMRDMGYPAIDEENYPQLTSRMEQYLEEFRACGVDRLQLEE